MRLRTGIAAVAVFSVACAVYADDVVPFFDWTPNNTPTGGWVSSWGGEAGNVTQSVAGPDGWPTNVYVVTASNASPKWSPYQSSCTAKDAFTFVTYGCVDSVSATSTGPAILWCMGHKNKGYDMTMLVKSGDGHVRLINAPSAANTYTNIVDVGNVAGWHLFTVRFSTTDGASVQIDDRDPVSDPAFVTMPGNGIQIGSLLGGIGSGNPFSSGAGFAVLRMIGYGTADLPAEQYAALCTEYPAATCAHSSTSDEVSWAFPQDATKVPESYVDGLVLGDTGIMQNLEFDGTNAVVASVLAELPDGVRGEIAGCHIYRASNGENFYAFAYSNGDGTFSLGHGTTTNKVTSSAVADWTAPHVWTFAFAAQTGAKLYCDGVEIASSDGIKWNNTSVTGTVTFGDDPRGGWPLSGAKLYAVHTDFGVGSSIFTAAEDAANSPLADFDFLADSSGEPIANQLAAFTQYKATGVTTAEETHECVLRISEILPKPTDARTLNGMEGMDVNGLESGWVEVENTSDKWADLADYRFIRVNRGKKTDPAGVGNFPSRLVPPHGRVIFYTSERYSNSKDKAVSAFAEGTFDGKPMIFEDYGNILVWGDKVNPKKSPYVRLYYAPGGDSDKGTVVDTVVVPSDLPEGWSIIVGDAEEGEGTRRWMCPTPTRGAANTATTGLTRIGPNVGPLYERPDQKKTDLASEFAAIAAGHSWNGLHGYAPDQCRDEPGRHFCSARC